ncbi:hypothetical protein CRE_17869 [Caenorhabditis remanei]|uniref:F-box associated domain-containing protein n=1 Tax=Caenorhabditis remanei TaxID=31234 RepID=E3MDU3_CAERE|nr:hypothetical protein CRE_17869 [Caenorhabditis remanei]
MTAILSYPGLKCVLEFLDAGKRIHIIFRTPWLQKVDKKIPLRLENLYLYEKCLWLSKLAVKLNSAGEIELHICQDNKNKKFRLLKQVESLEPVYSYYLGGGKRVYADEVHFTLSKSDLLQNVSLRINKLYHPFLGLESSLSFIDPKSFPLKKIKMSIFDFKNLDHPVIRSAEYLILNGNYDEDGEDFRKSLNKISNKNVLFKLYDDLKTANLKSYINYWKQNEKEMGTHFEFMSHYTKNNDIYNILSELKEEFGRLPENNLVGVDEQRIILSYPSFSIPLGSTSKILVYGADTSTNGRNEQRIVMKVVSIAAFNSTAQNFVQ